MLLLVAPGIIAKCSILPFAALPASTSGMAITIILTAVAGITDGCVFAKPGRTVGHIYVKPLLEAKPFATLMKRFPPLDR